MIWSGKTNAITSALTNLLGYIYGLPEVLYLLVLTSIRRGWLLFNITKSQEQAGLTARNTSCPCFNKSTQTRYSDIAPLVAEDNELGRFFSRYFFSKARLTQRFEQYLRRRPLLFCIISCSQIRHFISIYYNSTIKGNCQGRV